jgi:hypothetical protein
MLNKTPTNVQSGSITEPDIVNSFEADTETAATNVQPTKA